MFLIHSFVEVSYHICLQTFSPTEGEFQNHLRMAEEEETSIQDELASLILIADQVVKLAQEAEFSKPDCFELAKQATHLFQLLRSITQITASAHSLYEQPFRRILTDVSINLQQALSLVQSCRQNVILHFFSITATSTFEFHKVVSLLKESISDVKFLISVFNFTGPTHLSIPSISKDNPILACIWSYIAAVQMGQLGEQLDGARNLAFFSGEDKNKKVIVEECGIAPLLNLLNKGNSPEAQVAALTTLYNLATDQEIVKLMVCGHAVPIIAQILDDSHSSIDFQLLAVKLVSRMAEMDTDVQEEFCRENVTSTLLTLLSTETLSNRNDEMSSSSTSDDNTVKICCADALSKLSKGSLANSYTISKPESLLCLAKLVENELGALRVNCLNIVMELAAVAESNTDLRRTAFKHKSDATRTLLDQLLRVLIEEEDPVLLVPTIKSSGSLARTFPAKETRVIGLLVSQLRHSNTDVLTESTLALAKFVCPENYNRVEHSDAIIKFEGVPLLMNLIKAKNNDMIQVCALVLLCYLALYGGNCSVLVQARALNVLESRAEFAVSHNPKLMELFAQAIHQLELYQAGVTSYS